MMADIIVSGIDLETWTYYSGNRGGDIVGVYTRCNIDFGGTQRNQRL
jgi:hypothetical protein